MPYLPVRGQLGWTVGEEPSAAAPQFVGLTPVWPWFAGAAVLAMIIAWASSGSKKKQTRRARRPQQQRRRSIRVDFPGDRSRG